MEISEIGVVIAERVFRLRDAKGESNVKILLGMPRNFPDSSDFYAPYQIIGAGSERIRYAGGVDSLQSIELALQIICSEVEGIKSGKKGELIWPIDE